MTNTGPEIVHEYRVAASVGRAAERTPPGRRFDVATLAGIVERWVTATAADRTAEAHMLADAAIDSLMGTFAGGAFTTVNERLDPGIYFTDPQGHALIVGGDREATVLDMGGVVTIAGVEITDWDQLEALGERLAKMAREKMARAKLISGT